MIPAILDQLERSSCGVGVGVCGVWMASPFEWRLCVFCESVASPLEWRKGRVGVSIRLRIEWGFQHLHDVAAQFHHCFLHALATTACVAKVCKKARVKLDNNIMKMLLSKGKV